MNTFPPSKWDDFLKNRPKDFYETYHRLKKELDQTILSFLALENKSPDILHDLCMSTSRWALLWIDFDPFDRGESYNMKMVPFSKATRRLLSYARKQNIQYTQGFLGRYWRANNISRKRTSTSSSQPKKKLSPNTSQINNKPQAAVKHPDLCPRCQKAILKSKDILTYCDPITDSWETSRIWRCSKCYWRQSIVIEDSESSPYKRKIRRTKEDLGDFLRDIIASRMEKKTIGPKILKELGEEFSLLLHKEKQHDYAIIPKQSRRIRPLHDIEIKFLILLFTKYKDMYKSNIKQHWDKMIKTHQMQSWPLKELQVFLQENPSFIPSFNSMMCPSCLVALKCTYTEYRNMDLSTPNPIDLRPEKIEHWTCNKCQHQKIIRTDC